MSYVHATVDFSDVAAKALNEGAQRVHFGEQVVVVISEAEYLPLIAQQSTLKEHLLEGPDLSELNLERDSNPMREVEW